MSLAFVAIVVFVIVAGAVFLAGSLLDQRNARARLLRDRLAAVQKAAEREPSEELALLRDEMLSEIPALDSILRRSERSLQFSDAAFPGGHGNARRQHAVAVLWSAQWCSAWLRSLSASRWYSAGQDSFWARFLPYSYASYRRGKRFQTIRRAFPRSHRHPGARGARRPCLYDRH